MNLVTLFHFDSGYTFQKTIDSSKKITEHFTFLEEANPSSKEKIVLELWPQSLIHARMREDFRMLYWDKTGRVLPCNSCFRTEKFNRAVGGIENSLHRWATASDVGMPTLNDYLWGWGVDTWYRICDIYGTVGEIIRYPDYIHIGSHIECTPKPYTYEFQVFDKR